MGNDLSREDPLRLRLKHLVVNTLNLSNVQADWITDEEPLFSGRLGLDSLDALELYMGLEEEFGVEIVVDAGSRASLTTIAGLADFVRVQMAASKAANVTRPQVRISA
jgi:acyl carrier protein